MIVENFNRRIKSSYFEEFKNVTKLVLTEEKEKDCVFEIVLSEPEDNHFLIIKDLEHLKVTAASYILKDPPKDCDYAILDLKKKYAYLVELKNQQSTEGPNHLAKQLEAGEKWVEHLLFCANENSIFEETSEWKIYWAVLNRNLGRPSRRRLAPKVIHRDVKRTLPIFQTNKLPLNALNIVR